MKGNYLTKKGQPKDSFDPYLYNNGFGDRHFICSKCGSYHLTPIALGGMQPPKWICDECQEMNYAPKWVSVEENHPIENPVVEVELQIIEQVLKYCEDNQIYDKLGNYKNFYYKLNQIKRKSQK